MSLKDAIAKGKKTREDAEAAESARQAEIASQKRRKHREAFARHVKELGDGSAIYEMVAEAVANGENKVALHSWENSSAYAAAINEVCPDLDARYWDDWGVNSEGSGPGDTLTRHLEIYWESE